MKIEQGKIQPAIDPRVKGDAFFTPTVVSGGRTARRAKNIKIDDFGKKVIEDLAHRKAVPEICEEYGVSRQSVHYWVQKAEQKGIIVHQGLNPINKKSKLYRRGPNYHVLSYDEWQEPDFLPPFARIHFGNGSGISFHACNIEFENLRIPDKEGEYREEPLFIKGKQIGKNSKRYNAAFLIPEDIIGYKGAEATVTFNHNLTDLGRSTLCISPPEIRQTLDSLREEHDLLVMRSVILTVIFHFASGDWQIDSDDMGGIEDFSWMDKLHYAIDCGIVKKLYPDLMEGVHRLRHGEREEDFDIFIDHSHRHYELETTNRDLAIEMLFLLEANRKRLNGRKRDRKPGL